MKLLDDLKKLAEYSKKFVTHPEVTYQYASIKWLFS